MEVLRTERLVLRWFTAQDAAFILELVNDPGWIANIGDRGLHTLDDARAWIAHKLVTHYWQKGHGFWAMERLADGEVVGMSGLVDRDSLPAIDVGYALLPRFRGNGYAREATRACLDYAHDVLGRSRVLAIVTPTNQPSIRVLESVGMAALGALLLPGEESEVALFGRGTEAPDLEPAVAIDALARRFFSFFSNRHGIARVAAIPSLFLPEAMVTMRNANGANDTTVCSVPELVTPRAALLLGGRLADFEEEEVSQRTEIVGGIAHRTSRYRKSGELDGVPFEGAGNKDFQLVRTTRGWKIAALAWEDDARVGRGAAT